MRPITKSTAANFELEISKQDICSLNKEHQNIINKTTRIADFNGKLLE